MNRLYIVAAQLLCLALLVPVSLFPTPAFSQQEWQDPATILRNADALYNEKSYALAADEYGKWLTLAPADVAIRAEAEYRHMVALGKAERWNEAIAATDTFLAAPKREPMDRVRGLLWRADMYVARDFPYQGWQVGGQIVRGGEYPKATPEQQPKRISLRLENIQTSQQSYIEAIRIFERLPSTDRDRYRAQEIVTLRSAIENFPDTPTKNGQMYPPLPPGYDWTIDPTKPIDPEWHSYKRTFCLLARLENVAKSAGNIDASFWAKDFRAQYIQLHTSEWTRHNQRKFTVLIPYAEQNPAEIRLQAAKEFPTHSDAPQLLWQAAQEYNNYHYADGYWGHWKNRYNPAKAREIAQELRNRYPEAIVIRDRMPFYEEPAPEKERATVLAESLINQVEERSFFFGGSYPALLGRKGGDASKDTLIWNYAANPLASYTIPPAERMSFPLDTHNVAQVKIEVYRLNVNLLTPVRPQKAIALSGLLIGNKVRYMGDGVTLPTGSRKILEFTQKTGIHDDYRPTKTTVTLPKNLEPGAYIVRAIALEEPDKVSAVFRLVTDLTLVEKISSQEITSFVTDSKTGRPVAGAAVRMVCQKALSSKPTPTTVVYGKTDKEGVCRLALPQGEAKVYALSAQMSGNRYAFISHIQESEEDEQPRHSQRGATLSTESTRSYVYTDCPVYRPGQTVHFRVVTMRRTQPLQFRPRAGEKIKIEIRGPQSDDIYSSQKVADRFGTVHGELALGRGAALGNYSISVSSDEKGYTTFQVEEYKRPEFEASLDAAQEVVRLGDNATAVVTANYNDGRPVANAAVHYVIDRWGSGNTLPARSGDTVTGEDGKARIVFPTDVATDQNKRGINYAVHVTVTGSDRRVLESGCSIRAIQTPLEAHIQRSSLFWAVGDPIPLRLTVNNLFNLPVRVSGKLTIYRIDFSEKQRRYSYTDDTDWDYEDTTAANGEIVYSQKVEITGNQNQTRKLRWKPMSGGRFRAVWVLSDAEGNITTTHRELWVAEGKMPDAKARYGDEDGVHIRIDDPDHFVTHSYNPGDNIRVLVTCETPDCTFLLTKEKETGIREKRLIHLPGRSAILNIPVTREDAPNFTLVLVGVRNRKVMFLRKEIIVPVSWQRAIITVTGNKKVYRPGEKATFHVRATNQNGKPITAEVALGARDAALDGIAYDYSPDIFQSLYSIQDRILPLYADSNNNYLPFFVNSAKLDGTERIGFAPPGAGGPDDSTGEIAEEIPNLRSNFAETAFWFPTIVTDAKTGAATVTVTFPDSLTTWKATARGVTESVQVGETKTNFVTNKLLTVRLASPRFAIDGDRMTLSAIVRNDLATAKSVHVRLETGEAITTTPPKQTVFVPANAEKRVDFSCTVTASGPGKIRVYATTDVESDAMEIPLPVLEYGVQKFVASAGSLAQNITQASIPFTIPQEHKTGSAALLVQLAPHPATAILDALPYLADYPYGSVEQTVSRFLPSVLVASTLKKTGIDFDALQKRANQLQGREAQGKPFGQATPITSDTDQMGYTYPTGTPGIMKVPELAGELSRTPRANNPVFNPSLLERMTQEGIDRLRTMQRDSGGFAWWPDSKDVDSYMTAYVVYSLAEANSLGIEQSKRPLEEGAKYLARKIASETITDPNTVIWMLFALSNADSQRFESVKVALARVYETREALSPQGLAMLALTLQQTGDTARAETICRNLFNTVTIDRENNTARWQRSGSGWHWYDNDTETTAWALRAFLAVDSKNEIIPMLVQWLLQHKRGNAWNSTRETAIVVYALAEYIQQTSALALDMKVTVALGKSIQREYHITPDNVLLFDNRFLVADALLAYGEQTITITKQGTGPLTYSTALQYVSTEKQIRESGDQLTVTRNYYRTAQNTRERVLLREGDTLQSGDLITVELTVAAKNDYSYVLLEDFKPAGCEPVHLQSGFAWGTNLWATTQLRDTKTAFFIDSLPQGRHLLTYTLRAETPGLFHALPVNAYALYEPEVRALSDSTTLQITDTPNTRSNEALARVPIEDGWGSAPL